MIAKINIFFALLSVGAAIIGPLCARAQLLPPMAGMLLFGIGGLAGLAATIAATIAAVRYQAYFPAMIGSLGILPFLALLTAIIQGMSYPAINDITTTPEAAPIFKQARELPENAGRDMEFPQGFGPIITARYPDLKPLTMVRAPDLAYAYARDLASQAPFHWVVTRDDPESRTFEAVAETKLFRWKDDIIVHVQADDAGGSIVHMRSKSREGKSDIGANARRIRQFFKELQN